VAKGRVSIVHLIGVKHLISFITTLVKFILEVSVTEFIEVKNTVDSHRMVAFFTKTKVDFLPFLTARTVAPP
jgi:hypothetical protein